MKSKEIFPDQLRSGIYVYLISENPHDDILAVRLNFYLNCLKALQAAEDELEELKPKLVGAGVNSARAIFEDLKQHVAE